MPPRGRRKRGHLESRQPGTPEDTDAQLDATIEAHYRADEPWQYLPAQPPVSEQHPMAVQSGRRSPGRRGPFHSAGAPLRSLLAAVGWPSGSHRRSLPRARLVTVLALVGVISTGVVLAASSIFNLGKPTNAVSTNPYFPLSGFHHVKGLQPAGKARVLFIGTLTHDPTTGPDRWPLVKALEQFGTFSHLQPVDRVCALNAQAQRELCSDPTFDWSHATYRSSYVRFQERELLRWVKTTATAAVLKPYQRMNKAELALYKRFVHVPQTPKDPTDPYYAGRAVDSQLLPLMVVGNYVSGPSQIVHNGDFEEQLPPSGPPPTPIPASGFIPTYPSGLSFAQIQQALQTQTDPKGTTLVEDVNAEANIVTAIICRTDGGKPEKVCGRAVISSLLRHLH